MDMWVSMWEYVAVNVSTPGSLKKDLDPRELGLQVIGSHSTSVLETQYGILRKASLAVLTPEPFLEPSHSFFHASFSYMDFSSLDYRLVHANASLSSRILVIKSSSSLKNEVSKAEVY